MDTHTHVNTHRTTTVTLAAHARRGLNIAPYLLVSPHINFINIAPYLTLGANAQRGLLCVCVCVCVHSYLPPHTLESQKRDTNGFCVIQGSFLILPIFLNMLRSKVMA